MEYSKKGNVAPVDEINGSNPAGGSNPDDVSNPASQKIATQTSPVDSFFQKLIKLFEPSGLSLLFNFRETRLDLYVFYKEVTERGGFHLVTKDGKWDEVASNLNSKSIVSMSPIQLQKLYAHFLYQFEQTYHYRTPARVAAASGHSSGIEDNSSSSTGKRKHADISPFLTVDLCNKDGATAKKKCSDNSNQLSTAGPPKKKLVVQTPPKKDTKKDPNAPLRTRTAYQMFLRMECDRLKKIHGVTSASQNIRNMATDSWRHLSESERQPYVEESMKDKERFNREMTAYKEGKNTPGKIEGDYHVTLQLAPGNFVVPGESAAELASQLMKNGQPNEDALFQINWDRYCGTLDVLPF